MEHWWWFSHSVMSDYVEPHGLWPTRLLCPWDFPGKNNGVGCHFLLQRIFLTQRSNLRHLHWQGGFLTTEPPSVQFSSVQSLSVWLFAMPWTTARPPCPSPTRELYPNPCPLSQWCHATISSSVIPFSSCLQSFPASGSFPVSQLFTSGGQSFGVAASTSVLPMNIQDWSPLGWTGWISLQSKGLLRVFSNTIVQKHQFFRAQLSL